MAYNWKTGYATTKADKVKQMTGRPDSKSLVRNFKNDAPLFLKESYSEFTQDKLMVLKRYTSPGYYAPHYYLRTLTDILDDIPMTASELGERYYEKTGAFMGWVLLKNTLNELLTKGYVMKLV